MSTTHRSGLPLVPGYHHSGDRGLGVLATTVPSTGEHGPGIPFPSLTFPADNTAEVFFSILTVPPALTVFTVDEQGRVQAEGPPGTHVGTFALWVDGVSRGTSTYTIGIGPSGVLSGSNLMGPWVNTGTLAGTMPSSGTLSGNALMGPWVNSGTLAGVMPPSGVLSGNAVMGPWVNTGALTGVLPSSGALSGEAVMGAWRNSGSLFGSIAATRIAGRVSYAGPDAYIQRYGLNEAVQLLTDEQRPVTRPLLQEALAGVYSAARPQDDIAAMDDAYARLLRALETSSNFMDGYLRAAVTLPMALGDANAGTLAECCLALARENLADDCDNATEKITEDAKRWRLWLLDVSRRRVQLVGADGGAVPARGQVRFGRTSSAYEWGRYGPGPWGRR